MNGEGEHKNGKLPTNTPTPKKNGKLKPKCSRCKSDTKVVRKHHYPVGSRRLAYLCDRCYGVVRRQRKRSRNFGFF